MPTNFNWKKNLQLPLEVLPEKIRPFAQRVVNSCAGSNFDDEAVLVHIGKRAGAGLYCFDCGTTLCHEGTDMVHQYSSFHSDICPICHSDRMEDNIQSVCSFTWTAMAHYELLKALTETPAALALKLINNEMVVQNEYGVDMTSEEMLQEVKDCPIWRQLPRSFC